MSRQGGCSCGDVRYRMTTAPLIVHCCHCSWCQRQTGSAFALNALIEADRVELLQGKAVEVTLPSPSGKNQKVARCSSCQIALWSHYLVMPGGLGSLLRFVRVGTLDRPFELPPDIHIYTSTRQPWVVLPQGCLAVDEYYARKDVWRDESLVRLKALSNSVRGEPDS